MKKSLKRLLQCSIVLLLLNCQSEDLALDSHEHSKLKVQRISLEDLKSKPKAFEALNAIKEKRKTDAQAKTVYNSAYDFYVDTEEIVYIEKEESHSYTFAVYRKEKTAFFENLVMTQQEDGSYSATLVSYHLTEQERYDLDHEQLYSLDGKMSAIALDSGSIDQELLLNRLSCITVEIPTCSYGGHTHFAGPGCTQVDGTYSITACTNVSEPQAPISYISGSSGPGGEGGGGGGSTPNPETPITPEPTNPTPQPDPSNPIGEIGDITVPLIKPSPLERFTAQLNAQQLSWWNTATNVYKVQTITGHLLVNSYSESSKIFAKWSIDYLRSHPNVTVEQFKNWFMTPNEGKDFFYDEEYWEDPNLDFPQQDLPSWDDFNEAYPRIEGSELVQTIGGSVQQAYNQYPNLSRGYCALKVSRALNYAGITIPQITTTIGNPGTIQGADGKYYFLNAKALNKWMRETFGTFPDNPNHNHFTAEDGGVNGENFPTLVAGMKGIYSMVTDDPNHEWASGHADLINDSQCIFGCHFNDVPAGMLDYIDIWVLN